MTIDRLGAATIRQIHGIHESELKSYRNACAAIKRLEPYVHTIYFNKEKVLYLNKPGRDLIGSDKEIKQNQHLEHNLLRNEAYIYLNKPVDWQIEKSLEYEVQQANQLGILIKGMNVATKNRVIADAYYTRNGYTHLVEIDNKSDMKDNLRKIKSYVEYFKFLDTPRLEIFTRTSNRKNTFKKWLLEYKLRGEVLTYDEIR